MCRWCNNDPMVTGQVAEWTNQGWQNRLIAEELGLPIHAVIQIKNRHHIRRKPTAGGGYIVTQRAILMGERCPDCGCPVDTSCPVPRCPRYAGEVSPEARTLGGVTREW